MLGLVIEAGQGYWCRDQGGGLTEVSLYHEHSHDCALVQRRLLRAFAKGQGLVVLSWAKRRGPRHDLDVAVMRPAGPGEAPGLDLAFEALAAF